MRLIYNGTHMTDEELMIMVKNDDNDAFGLLYEKYKDVIYRYIIFLIGQNPLIEDIFQEVFLSIYKNRNSYIQTAKFTTYIYSITRNKCIDFIRKNGKYLNTDQDFIEKLEYFPDEDQSLMNKSVKNDFLGLIGVFPEKQRSAIYLKDIEGFGYEEISAIINIPLGTVKSLIHRAREIVYDKLRRKYE